MAASGRFLTADQIADELGVSLDTVWRWCRQGQLPAQRIGPGRGHLRVSRENYETWLSRQRKASA